ncbi:hypothetical protein AAY473_034036, partial [Plecturocebus cupreus]
MPAACPLHADRVARPHQKPSQPQLARELGSWPRPLRTRRPLGPAQAGEALLTPLRAAPGTWLAGATCCPARPGEGGAGHPAARTGAAGGGAPVRKPGIRGHDRAGPWLLAAPPPPGPSAGAGQEHSTPRESTGRAQERVPGLSEQRCEDQQREEIPSSRGCHCLPPHLSPSTVIFFIYI